MMAAVTPYVTWLSSTAAQAEETANQARAAVSAYEAAFAMTVPPPAIAANRALLMALVATNFFGQNTPAIMATEALYVEMWLRTPPPCTATRAPPRLPYRSPHSPPRHKRPPTTARATRPMRWPKLRHAGESGRDGGPERRRSSAEHLRADDRLDDRDNRGDHASTGATSGATTPATGFFRGSRN